MNELTTINNAAAEAETKETVAVARKRLFDVYPELQQAYATISPKPFINFDKKWLTNECGKKIVGFINFVKLLEVEELFPNWDALNKAASITDGGTISKELEEIVSYLGLAAGGAAVVRDNPTELAKFYRRVAGWIIDRNKIDTFMDRECGVIKSACEFCNLELKNIEDAIKVEISLRTFLG